MMHLIPKWAVTITLSDGRMIVVGVYDNHLSNVSLKLAGIEWAPFPVEVLSLSITRAPEPTTQTNVVTA